MTPPQPKAYHSWRCWLLLRTACYSWGGEAGVTTAAAAAEWVSLCSHLSAVVPVLMCLRLNCTLTMVDIYGLEQKTIRLECGQMPNLMVALPNIGGALCSTPQSLADAHY